MRSADTDLPDSDRPRQCRRDRRTAIPRGTSSTTRWRYLDQASAIMPGFRLPCSRRDWASGIGLN